MAWFIFGVKSTCRVAARMAAMAERAVRFGNNSLWHAFQVFTVWRPYAGSEVGNALHSNTRVGYLNALHQAAKAKRLDPAFGAVQTAFPGQIAEWRKGAAADRVLGDFLDMLEVELRSPVWSGW